jgi:non-ribosomal peptide synthetase component F
MTGLPHVGEVLRANARLFPERVGARDLERAMTFRQWNARACRLANALLGLGLGKGDRVAVLAYNCVEWLKIYAATATERLGHSAGSAAHLPDSCRTDREPARKDRRHERRSEPLDQFICSSNKPAD